MLGDSITTSLLQKALDGTWQRQKAIAANIANHETPGYKASTVSFEKALQHEVQQLNRTGFTKKNVAQGMAAIDNSKIQISLDHTGIERADGNNVNLETENINMAKAQIQYQYLTRSLTDYYSRLRYALSEGKR
jgi:flagellar basal-body rod protein FlgB